MFQWTQVYPFAESGTQNCLCVWKVRREGQWHWRWWNTKHVNLLAHMVFLLPVQNQLGFLHMYGMSKKLTSPEVNFQPCTISQRLRYIWGISWRALKKKKKKKKLLTTFLLALLCIKTLRKYFIQFDVRDNMMASVSRTDNEVHWF